MDSDILGGGTPAEQVAAYVELLDKLGIDKVYLLATSAGGSIAIRFALDYPERTKGLILYCSAMPLATKPVKYAEYAGPPAFLCNDYAMFLLNPLFEPVMGMDSSTIYGMLPVGKRKAGVVLDTSIYLLEAGCVDLRVCFWMVFTKSRIYGHHGGILDYLCGCMAA